MKILEEPDKIFMKTKKDSLTTPNFNQNSVKNSGGFDKYSNGLNVPAASKLDSENEVVVISSPEINVEKTSISTFLIHSRIQSSHADSLANGLN
jgi:hypothetical protein